MKAILHLCLSVFICGSVFGCSTAVNSGQSTALSGIDLVQMTDDMAMKIAGDADVQRSVAEQGKLRVVVLPVENRMRAEVLPRGAAEAFVGRVRTLLAKRAPDQFTWIMNREAYHALRARELNDVDLGPPPGAVQPQYSLSAVFSSLADEDKSHRSSFYVCRYELTDLHDGGVLWTGSYDVKKVAVKGFGD